MIINIVKGNNLKNYYYKPQKLLENNRHLCLLRSCVTVHLKLFIIKQ